MKPPRGTLIDHGHPLSRGLILAFPLNEGGGSRLFDHSGNGNHGEIQGIGVSWSETVFGGGLSFPGTAGNYVQVSDSFTLNKTKDLSICFRFRPVDVDGGTQSIVARGEDWDNDVAQWIVELDDTLAQQTIQLWYEEADDTDHETKFSDALTSGEWYSVAVTMDDRVDVRVYKDGAEAGTASTDLPEPGSVATPVTIGARRNAPSSIQDFYEGLLDYVYIYGRALAPAEVLRLHKDPFQMFGG